MIAARAGRAVTALLLAALVAGCSDDAAVSVRSAEPNVTEPTATTTTAPTAGTVPVTNASPTTDQATPSGESTTTTAAQPTTGEPTSTTAPQAPHPGAAGIGDPYFPTYGNGGYDTTHYDLDVAWDPTTEAITGTATIDAVATENLTSFNLDFSNALDVSGVEVGGAPAGADHAAGELVVTPATSLTVGETFQAIVRYSGVPLLETGASGFAGGWQSDGAGGIVVAGEPESAANWYPVNDHPADKAAYTIHLTVPDGITAVSNGTLVSQTPTGSGTTTWTYDAPAPMAPYLVTVIIGDYTVVDGGTSSRGTPIRNVFPSDEVDTYRQAFADQGRMIDRLEDWFGPYPFDVYGAAVTRADLGYALEVQTLSVFSAPLVDDLTIVHELAHQWYGDSVSIERWQDIWLNEGFATFAESLWPTDTGATTATQMPAYPVPPGDPGPVGLFDDSVYHGGGVVLQNLAARIGVERFKQAMTAYATRYRHGNATTQDFIDVVDDVTGGDHAAFIDHLLGI